MDAFLELLKTYFGSEIAMFVTGFFAGISSGYFLATKFLKPKPQTSHHNLECVLDEKENKFLRVQVGISDKIEYIVCPIFENGKCLKDGEKCIMYNIIAPKPPK